MWTSSMSRGAARSIRAISMGLPFLAPLVADAVAADPLVLTGIVRDFTSSHPDFAPNIFSVGGYGHYAANIEFSLGLDTRPAFVGGGFSVATQWQDQDGNNIAPHLYATSGAHQVPIGASPTVINLGIIDSYDPAAGSYGGANVGPTPTWSPGASPPIVTAPTGLPAKIGRLEFSGVGTSVIGTDIHCDEFIVADRHKLEIDGEVTILVDKYLEVRDKSSVIELLPGSTLKLYIQDEGYIRDTAKVNAPTGDPRRILIFNLGTEEFVVENTAMLGATIFSPDADLEIANDAEVFGTFRGRSFSVDNSAAFHLAVNLPIDNCATILDDTRGQAGIQATGGITSNATFDEWYRDILHVNLSMPYPLVLIPDGSGAFEYVNDEFYPIDGMMLGNEGNPHNYHFTMEIRGEFTYKACSDQFFEFMGADDAWLFIDGDLAIDLGGLRVMTWQRVDFDRLELVDGQTYQLRFYYAHRDEAAVFRMRTNLDMETSVPTFSAPLD